MKQYTFYLAGIFLLFHLSPSTIKAQFKVDAQLRNRFEFRDGYQQILSSTAIPAFLITQRTRLSFSYETEKVKLRFTPQDVRVWGDEQLASSTGVFGDQASLDLFEGYAMLKMGSQMWFSIGRQQLVYDNQRMLAQRNWNQHGISYDAVLVRFSINGWDLHIAGSWNTLNEISSQNFYSPHRIKSLNFIWVHRKLSEYVQASLMHIASGITETDTTNAINFRQTSGFYSTFNRENFSLWGDIYYQYGKNNGGKPVSAFLAGIDASYLVGRFTPGIGFEYLSGNSESGNAMTTDRLFDLLYGARHRYLGQMDYFRNIGPHTGDGGLVDYYFYLNFEISKPVSIMNTGHFFQLAQINLATPDDRNLGYENDLVIKYKFSDWGMLEGGYMFLLPTESLKIIQNVADDKFPQFAYVQLTLTPTLFQQHNH